MHLKNKKAFIAISFFILTGIVFRLIWIEDMEWKGDEQTMFKVAQEAVETGKWPLIGLVGSAGIPHPGMHIWVFSVIALLAHDPISMTRIVQFLNIFTIAGFCLFTVSRIENDQKEIWLWGIALASVSPLAVLFSRKLWVPDILPFFSLLVIIGHAYRRRGYGAFFWGFSGAIIGQVHMSGFSYALALVISTLLYERINRKDSVTKWGYWFAGSVIGSIGLIPWVIHLWVGSYSSSFKLLHVIANIILFPLLWSADALGIGLQYSMHSSFWSFLKGPYINGIPTFGIAVLHFILVAIGLFSFKLLTAEIKLWISRIKSGDAFKGLSLLDFYLYSFFFIMGLFTIFGGVVIYAHHLIIIFPFIYLSVVKILYPRKKLILTMIMSQLLITFFFLNYVHKHEGVLDGDYGKSYKAQMVAKEHILPDRDAK